MDNPEIAKAVYDWAVGQWKPKINVQALEQLVERTREERGESPTVESLVDLRFFEEVLAEEPAVW